MPELSNIEKLPWVQPVIQRLTPSCTTAVEPAENIPDTVQVGIFCGTVAVQTFILTVSASTKDYTQDTNLGCAVFKQGLNISLFLQESSLNIVLDGTIESNNQAYVYNGLLLASFPQT
jgi:hypothetical protein